MKRTFRFVTLLALVLLPSAVALAATDFSGTWVLDLARSDMGNGRPMPAPTAANKVTLVIKQTATTLTIDRTVGDKSGTAVFKLDGSESTNKLPSGAEIKSTTTPVGPTLVTKSTAVVGGSESKATDVYSLSADGKVMTIEQTQATPQGEKKRKLVYDRQ